MALKDSAVLNTLDYFGLIVDAGKKRFYNVDVRAFTTSADSTTKTVKNSTLRETEDRPSTSSSEPDK
jgi:hypothetical protein